MCVHTHTYIYVDTNIYYNFMYMHYIILSLYILYKHYIIYVIKHVSIRCHFIFPINRNRVAECLVIGRKSCYRMFSAPAYRPLRFTHSNASTDLRPFTFPWSNHRLLHIASQKRRQHLFTFPQNILCFALSKQSTP